MIAVFTAIFFAIFTIGQLIEGGDYLKNGKRPTRKEKLTMLRYNLNPNNWLVSKRHGEILTLVHRYTNQIREIPKD